MPCIGTHRAELGALPDGTHRAEFGALPDGIQELAAGVADDGAVAHLNFLVGGRVKRMRRV